MSDSLPPVDRDLGGGLRLRSISPADTGDLTEFTIRVFGHQTGEPDVMAGIWAGELSRGDHPAVPPDDGVLVVDTANGRIVSSCFFIRQTWTYAGIPFGVGRPELIATDPDYRNRGLVRAQMEEVHARSAALGHRMQALTGIPYFYRQFGYEPTLVTSGGRQGAVAGVPELAPGETEPVVIRPAAEPDLPCIARMYRKAAARALVATVRDEPLWRHELLTRDPGSDYWHHLAIIEAEGGRPLGFLSYINEIRHETLCATVCELEDGVPWQTVAPAVVRSLRAAGEQIAASCGERLSRIGFEWTPGHPLLQHAGDFFTVPMQPFAWQVRIDDLAGFIRLIAPELERRLATSAFAGFGGELAESRFSPMGCASVSSVGISQRWSICLHSRIGKPDPHSRACTFLNLLLGSRSVDELAYAFPGEAWARTEVTRLLLDTLFPKTASAVWPVA